jgi:type IV pilus assembly protein PilA
LLNIKFKFIGGFIMKKILKGNKGFSLVELLIALLIMAVIAATAITLFGGVLETSKGGADRETADAIKRAILTYMNASNDGNLSALGVTKAHTAGKGGDAVVVAALASKTDISYDAAQKKYTAKNGEKETERDGEDLVGTYGPFLEKEVTPSQNGKKGWEITINSIDQIITVTPAEEGSLTITNADPDVIPAVIDDDSDDESHDD